MKKTRFFDLRNNPDPDVRFPPPTIKQGVVPLWSLDDLDAYDARQRELVRQGEARKKVVPIREPELAVVTGNGSGTMRRPGPK